MVSLKEPLLLEKVLIEPAVVGRGLLKHWTLDIFVVPILLADDREHGVATFAPLLAPRGRRHV